MITLNTCCRTPAITEYGEQTDALSNVSDTDFPETYLTGSRRVELANKHLAERGLIKHEKHESELHVFVIELMLDRYDLGRKYSSWFQRSGLWFQEYRNHWIWFLAALVGGAIGAKLTD